MAACGPGFATCGGSCADLTTDNLHCGNRNTACSGGSSCESGVCVCAGGRTLCASGCADLQSDASHCGGCGAACGPGRSCVAGRCFP